MAPSELGRIEPLSAAELDAAQALVREAGWNQTAADWRIFLELGCVRAIRTREGRVIATAATLPYEKFAWISMVLVAGEFRRRGLATLLLRRCLDDLAATIPVLDATPAGREVYRALGFQDSWGFQRLARPHPARTVAMRQVSDGLEIQPISDAVWPKLCAYDAAAFGADRSGVLARLRGRLAPAELFARRNGRIVGALLGRDGRIASQLGPLVAEDAPVAQALLARALENLDGALFVDLLDAKVATRAWLEAQGFAAARPLTRMIFGRSAAFDDGLRTFAVIGPEFG